MRTGLPIPPAPGSRRHQLERLRPAIAKIEGAAEMILTGGASTGSVEIDRALYETAINLGRDMRLALWALR